MFVLFARNEVFEVFGLFAQNKLFGLFGLFGPTVREHVRCSVDPAQENIFNRVQINFDVKQIPESYGIRAVESDSDSNEIIYTESTLKCPTKHVEEDLVMSHDSCDHKCDHE